VTITHESAASVSAGGTAAVSGGSDPIIVNGMAINATEGTDSGAVTVATFTDPTASSTSQDTASIDWGDGSAPTTATIVNTGGNNFAVVGHHTYLEEGNFTFTVTINQPSAGPFTRSNTATVTDAPLGAQGTTIKLVEGKSYSRVLAWFTDSDPNGTVADYTATVDWGDGTGASSASIVSVGSGYFAVRGAHTYAEEGSYKVTITINDHGAAATVMTMAKVSDAPLRMVGKSAWFTVQKDQSFTRALVTFSDADPNGTAADYSATIYWGDGTSSAGSISQNGSCFDVTGKHTYRRAGEHEIRIVVKDAGGALTRAEIKVRVVPPKRRGDRDRDDAGTRSKPALDAFFGTTDGRLLFNSAPSQYLSRADETGLVLLLQPQNASNRSATAALDVIFRHSGEKVLVSSNLEWLWTWQGD